MKLFSATIIARLGALNITRDVYVIAENKKDTFSKIGSYIKNDPKLSQAQIRSVVATEEVVIQ